MIRPLLALLLGLGFAISAAEPLPGIVIAPGTTLTVPEDGPELVIPFTLTDALAGDGSDRIIAMFATLVTSTVPTVEVVGVVRADLATSGTLRLRPLPNQVGSSLLVMNLVTNDGLVGGLLLSVEVLAVDDAPLLAVNVPAAVGIGGTVAYTAANLLLEDVDEPAASQLRYTLSVTPAHGEVRLDGTPLGVGGIFTQADIAAGSVTYRNLDGQADLWSFTWDDGPAKPTRGPATTTVTVAGRALPWVSLIGGNGWQEGMPPVRFAAGSLVEDGDSAHLSGGSLTASTSNVSFYDELSFLSEGNGAGQIAVVGNVVSYGGLAIGTWRDGSYNQPLIVDFTGTAATPAAVQALVRRLQFYCYSKNPGNTTRIVTVVVNDGDAGASPPAQVQVPVVPVNDPPETSDLYFSTPMNSTWNFAVWATDPEYQLLTWTVPFPPWNGSLSQVFADSNVFRYTPNPEFSGMDSFAILISDGQRIDACNVMVTVCGPNDPHLLPLADPPRELFPGDTLNLTVSWDRGGVDAPLLFSLDGHEPAGAGVVSSNANTTANVSWTVPLDHPTGVHVRFKLLAGFLGDTFSTVTGAGVLPFSILIRPLPGGGG